MPDELTSLETNLLKLRATAPDAALLARLEACAAGTWTQLTPEETALEQALRSVRPAPLSGRLQTSLEAILENVEFPSEPKIVPFPAPASTTLRSGHKWWAAAAAVALTGALTALMIPVGTNRETHRTAAAPAPPASASPTSPRIDSSQLIPAGFNRDLREAKDEGVVWRSGQNAHRVIRVVYMDRVTLMSPDGKSYEVEQPRVEYILTPEQAD